MNIISFLFIFGLYFLHVSVGNPCAFVAINTTPILFFFWSSGYPKLCIITKKKGKKRKKNSLSNINLKKKRKKEKQENLNRKAIK